MNKKNIIKYVVIIFNMFLFYYLVFMGRNQYFYNMSYLRCILFMMFNSLFVFFSGIIENNKKSYDMNIIIYIVFYSYLLFAITFIISRDTFRFYNWWYTGQYKPFYTILSQFKYGSFFSIVKNIIGNSVMIIPLSFLLMIKNKKYNSLLRQSFIILPFVIVIELLQAFTHTGSFDVDDIILNYLGSLIFIFIVTRLNIIDKIRELFYKDFNIKNKSILFYSGLVIVLIYNIILLIKT